MAIERGAAPMTKDESTWKIPVRAASTADINLAAPGASVDGVALVANNHDSFLAKNQTAGAENGPYRFNGAAVPATRIPEADANEKIRSQMVVKVMEGTANESTMWKLDTPNPIVVGTTILAFSQIPGGGTIALHGIVPANNGADADHDIDFSSGAAPDSTHTQSLILPSTFIKQIDVAWVAGTPAGGLFSGTVAADTWYHLFVIKKDSDGSIDAGFDTSVVAANIPAGYTKFKRVGSVLTDGSSDIIAFSANEVGGGGLDVLWLDPPLDVDDSSSSSTAETRTLSVPTGYKVSASMNVYAKKPNYLSSFDANDEPASDAVAPLANTSEDGFNHVSVRTNTSGQIRSRAFSGGDILRIATLGWTDGRRD